MCIFNLLSKLFLLQDLSAIGITKPGHRKRLKAEIARLNIHDGIPDFKPVIYINLNIYKIPVVIWLSVDK